MESIVTETVHPFSFDSYDSVASSLAVDRWPVMICLLGPFRLLKHGAPVARRSAAKAEALLSTVALRNGQPVPRDVLLSEVWPDADPALSCQALNSLVHSLQKQFTDVLGGASLIVHRQGCYQINSQAGVGVDTTWFTDLANAGERLDRGAAVAHYASAIDIYQGDLRANSGDQYAIIERERLRGLYLSLLARCAAFFYDSGDWRRCIELASRLLLHDPCREDAHRLLMRCYVQRGERAQALRQFRVCAQILRAEFDAELEPETLRLYDQIRLNADET